MKEISLLPPGFRDDLSPITEYEHEFIGKIISIFNSNNYQIVKPPLVEFMNNDNSEGNNLNIAIFLIYFGTSLILNKIVRKLLIGLKT